VPEQHFSKIIASVPSIIATRSSMTVFMAYRRSAPITLSPWFLAELTLYPIVLDFFFYIDHRATPEIDGLWKYHRTHHLTKHPNPLLSSYADVEQEIMEMAVVPLLTYATLKFLFGFPMTFYDWWLCQCFTFFAEAIGHSGLRAMFQVPGPGGHVMRLIGCELVLEDHDLHHRQGWRKSGNYGKATKLWDRIFGTGLPLIEAQWDRVDYENAVRMPIF
jgi:sterol desaturase/sphingolipid hydroxylase (fatty acid hydroxylase superfamily)